jgi:hypothetical protein
MVTQASSRLTNSCSENHSKKFPLRSGFRNKEAAQ